MIVYRDTNSAERIGPPPWCDGAANLHSREDARSGRLWGIGDAFLLGPSDTGWTDLDDGWQCRLVGMVNAGDLKRDQRWCDLMPATSLEGVVWMAPRILDVMGNRGFRVSYGDDFLPALTADQKRAYAIAEESRVLLTQAAETGGFSASLGARYAADLLSISNHATMQVFAKMRLIDDAVILSVLQISAGFVKEPAHAA